MKKPNTQNSEISNCSEFNKKIDSENVKSVENIDEFTSERVVCRPHASSTILSAIESTKFEGTLKGMCTVGHPTDNLAPVLLGPKDHPSPIAAFLGFALVIYYVIRNLTK